jgi:hypothetical protein
MAATEQPYDPYIPSGSNGAPAGGQNGNQRTAALQAVSALSRMLGIIAALAIGKPTLATCDTMHACGFGS